MNVYSLAITTALLTMIAALPARAAKSSAPGPKQPIELGDVSWHRDFDEALRLSAKQDKPIFVLFQEVPGCSNCTRFGQQTLSHPLIVEAIETLFVPLAVFNNKGGADAAVLKRYGEPAWNNPVVRLVDAEGEDIIERLPDFRSPALITTGMIRALTRRGDEVPGYLRLIDEELRAQEAPQATATFQTACFWSGEGHFGAQAGVLATEAGWQDGAEVVRVTYASDQLSTSKLTEGAAKQGYRKVDNGTFRLDREPKYYLTKSRYAKLELTPLQAARVNSLIGQRRSPDHLLSPRQLASL